MEPAGTWTFAWYWSRFLWTLNLYFPLRPRIISLNVRRFNSSELVCDTRCVVAVVAVWHWWTSTPYFCAVTYSLNLIWKQPIISIDVMSTAPFTVSHCTVCATCFAKWGAKASSGFVTWNQRSYCLPPPSVTLKYCYLQIDLSAILTVCYNPIYSAEKKNVMWVYVLVYLFCMQVLQKHVFFLGIRTEFSVYNIMTLFISLTKWHSLLAFCLPASVRRRGRGADGVFP